MLQQITRHADDKIAEEEAESAPLARVLPFSRTRLGQGARYGELPVSDDPGAEHANGSPVYLPGDPRLER